MPLTIPTTPVDATDSFNNIEGVIQAHISYFDEESSTSDV